MHLYVTLKIVPKTVSDAQGNEKALVGYLETRFDIMNKEFTTEYSKRNGFLYAKKDSRM